jgi:4-aminobutyrate aminotransferase-like enzyme
VIRILSPLVIEDADLDRGLDVIEESLLEAANIPQHSA